MKYEELARKAELKGEWSEALKYWKLAGSKIDIAAVELIIESNRKGDLFREKSKSIFDLLEEKKITIYDAHEKLCQITKEIYG